MLNYQRLDAYQCALQLARASFRVIEKLPSGNSELSDQMRRAAISILLNIAEGSGKTSEKDRARYYASARGSAMECSAIVDVLELMSLIDSSAADEARGLAERAVLMLTRMCRA